MKEALRPILSCALVVAVSAAVQGQLTDTKFEKYTRFLTALILLSLLITPMLNLFAQGADALIPEEGEIDADGTPDPPPSAYGYTDALLSVLAGRIEDDARSVLSADFGLGRDSVADLRVTLDGSDPEAIRVSAVEIDLVGSADTDAISQALGARYGCENVRVNADA